MKNKELFNKTIGILVNAYFNGTLLHTNCHALRGSNIVAANMGYSFKLDPNARHKENELIWSHLKSYESTGNYFDVCNNREMGLTEIGKIEIESTGYTPNEIKSIERAFEDTDEYHDFEYNSKKTADEWMFDGLMSVCDCLMDIHEASLDEITETKKLFIKKTV